MIKFLDLKFQYNSIKSEIDNAIYSVVNEAAFIGGEYLATFESQFAKYCDSKFCIGVGNGTDALEIALEAAGLPEGSEVLVPGNSFISSSEAVTRCGLKVVFCDVDIHNYTICPDSIRQYITEKTSAIIAVHLYGHPCDMDEIMNIAKEHNLIIIEDCAQAHGALYKGSKVGSLGHFGTFSFYPGKNLGAYGDGGAITTQDENFALLARKIANHGRISKYNHEFEGRNSRLDALQASILSTKLAHLDNWTKKRVLIADFYLENLIGLGDLVLPKREGWAYQVYHLYVIRSKHRDDLKKFLEENGVQTGVHYPIALPKLAAYKYLGQPDSEAFYNTSDVELLSLPIGEHLTVEDAGKIVDLIKLFFSQ